MQFRLHYRGPLKASGRKPRRREVHKLRRHFHGQLRDLWCTEPLASHNEFWAHHRRAGIVNIREEIGPFTFVPLITKKLYLVAGLNVLLLRPAPPGELVGHGGDLDNRLKTLLDGLRLPAETEIPAGDKPSPEEEPFFVLLQDDALVTELSVSTDRLLEPGSDDSEVLLVVQVRLGATESVFDNLGLLAT